MRQKNPTAVALGDGVYVDFYADGSFRLWTERASGTDEIYFEPGMLEHLARLRFAAMAKVAEAAQQAPGEGGAA